MYERPKTRATSIRRNVSKQGEPLHEKIERMTKQKIKMSETDTAPLIYTDRKEGVRPNTDIRTDRFEVAIVAADNIAKGYTAKRDGVGKKADKTDGKGDGKAESTAGKGAESTTGEGAK